jgi:DNA (cytosine-5)-methyltransferase 1
MPKEQLTHISLFTGAGGLDIGLEHSGFETRLCVEDNVDCSATLEANRHHFRNPEFDRIGDITKLSPGEVLEYSGLSVGEVDLISGGPPCQSFSTAGKRQSINDDRGILIDYFLMTVDFAKPRFFVMENVRGLRSAALRHRPLNQRGNGHRPLQDNEQLGSLLKLRVLPALNAIGYQ